MQPSLMQARGSRGPSWGPSREGKGQTEPTVAGMVELESSLLPQVKITFLQKARQSLFYSYVSSRS